MSRARKPQPPPEFEAWAEEATRYDAWQEHREGLQAKHGGVGAFVPTVCAMEPPDWWETPEGYVSPRVERKRQRLATGRTR